MDSMTAKDQTLPSGRWAFDDSVTAVFDDMLARSIPQYEVMRNACFDVGRRYVKEHTQVIDMGCSRGEALSRFVEQPIEGVEFIGLEISRPMLNAAAQRFQGVKNVLIVEHDLRSPFPYRFASLTLAVLTLQFTPIEYRQRILRDVYKATVPGGAFILVEKILGATADVDRLMVETYYDMKREQGYTEDQIQRKRLSLEGVLVPVTAAWNEQLLHQAGFNQIDCFWRWMNFAAWVAIRD